MLKHCRRLENRHWKQQKVLMAKNPAGNLWWWRKHVETCWRCCAGEKGKSCTYAPLSLPILRAAFLKNCVTFTFWGLESAGDSRRNVGERLRCKENSSSLMWEGGERRVILLFRKSYLYTFTFVSLNTQDCRTPRGEKERWGLWSLSASTGMPESQRGGHNVWRTHNNVQDSLLIFLLNFWPLI